MQHPAESAKQSSLAKSRHSLQQHVTTGQQACQNTIDYRLLADDDFSDFPAHQIEITGGELKRGISTHVFYSKVKTGVSGNCFRTAVL
jgi:hypothetical protein